MKFVHQREHFNEDDIVVIGCSQRCSIHLMSDVNFRSFKNGGRHSCYDGAFGHFPAKIKVPSIGLWDTTINTMTRRPISVTCKPNFKWLIKFVRRSSSQFI